MQLSKYQPSFYRTSGVMRCINAALEKELERLQAAAESIRTELNISTAVERISDWEASVGLTPNDNLAIESRRSRVLARYRQAGAATKARIKSIVESYARGSVEIIEYSSEYTVLIRFTDKIGIPDNMDGIIEQLGRIMPAHLAVNFEYKYRTWQQVLDTGKTWGELYNAGYTWDDILNKEEL